MPAPIACREFLCGYVQKSFEMRKVSTRSVEDEGRLQAKYMFNFRVFLSSRILTTSYFLCTRRSSVFRRVYVRCAVTDQFVMARTVRWEFAQQSARG